MTIPRTPSRAPSDTRPRAVVLASSSPYRRALLERLRIPFSSAAPDIDESRRPGERALALVRRLARQKAAALAPAWPGALVIGSDQVAVNDGQVLGKPGSHAAAVHQLRAASGRSVEFPTAVCVLDSANGHTLIDIVTTTVVFRKLGDTAIERYLAAEQPYDCAGSFKIEGAGFVLFESVQTDDPTGLIGLPMIWVADRLLQLGYLLP